MANLLSFYVCPLSVQDINPSYHSWSRALSLKITMVQIPAPAFVVSSNLAERWAGFRRDRRKGRLCIVALSSWDMSHHKWQPQGWHQCPAPCVVQWAQLCTRSTATSSVENTRWTWYWGFITPFLCSGINLAESAHLSGSSSQPPMLSQTRAPPCQRTEWGYFLS